LHEPAESFDIANEVGQLVDLPFLDDLEETLVEYQFLFWVINRTKYLSDYLDAGNFHVLWVFSWLLGILVYDIPIYSTYHILLETFQHFFHEKGVRTSDKLSQSF